MNKSAWIRRLLEIYVNTSVRGGGGGGGGGGCGVMSSARCNDRSCIAVFSGDDVIFPIILEITDNPYHIELGYIDVFLIANKPVRKSKKQRDLLKLIMKYLQTNNLIKISHD